MIARRRRVALMLVLAWPAAASAQRDGRHDWQREAVPLVAPEAFVRGVWRDHALPRAQAFVRAARALQAAAGGEPAALREAWRAALPAWAGLAALGIGPLAERRSARRIHFAPTRPASVRQAIERLAADPALAFDLVGGPAKGFGALAWLAWDAQAPDTPAARRYAAFVAAEIAAEAEALAAAFAALAVSEPDEAALVAAFAEIVNQWIGGLEALHLAALRPQEPGRAPGPPDAAALERQARWAALAALTHLADGAPRPPPGAGLVPIEMLLRGRGLNPLADRLHAAAAAQDLRALRHLAQAEVAPAIEVRVGFSDADGD